MKKIVNMNAVKNEDGTFNVSFEGVNLSVREAQDLLGGLEMYADDYGIEYQGPDMPELQLPTEMDIVNSRLKDMEDGTVQPISIEDIVNSLRSIPGMSDKKISIHPDLLDDISNMNKNKKN